MKKKYLSIIVVIFTIIAVWIMLANNISYEDDYMMVQKSHSKILKAELFTKIKSEEVQFDNNKNYEIRNDERIKIEVKEENYRYENKTIEKEIEIGEENKGQEIKDEKGIKKYNEETLKKEGRNNVKNENLFRVNKNEILGQLTKEDKAILKKLIKKLSISDYANILYSIKNNGELECCLKITNILNRRLDKTDYNMAKEILDPYINIEFLEEKLAFK